MKAIAFLSRFTLICNIAFIVFITFGFFNAGSPGIESTDVALRVPFLKELIIILGFSAILVNFLMCLTYGILLSLGKRLLIPRWLSVINLSFLLLQIWYFFF